MKKPLIGITVNYDPLDIVGMSSCMGISGQDWSFVAGDYVYGIEKAGGIPVLLPRTKSVETLKPLIDAMDGILVTGGHDVDPHSYNERTKGYCGRVVPQRDEMDLFVTRYAYEQKKPLLGICRGIQIMNAAFGGKLYQDLEKEGGFEHHFMDNTPREYPVHTVTIEKDSILGRILGETAEVNSFHHQAVKDPGENVRIIAHSADGVPESIEVSGGNAFTLGVQWHPEMMFTSDVQLKIFRALVDACAK